MCQTCRAVSKQRIARAFRHAAIPERHAAATFTSFPGARTSGIRDVEAWAEGAGKRSLVLYGPFGRGKTSLAIAALKVWVEREQCTALVLLHHLQRPIWPPASYLFGRPGLAGLARPDHRDKRCGYTLLISDCSAHQSGARESKSCCCFAWIGKVH